MQADSISAVSEDSHSATANALFNRGAEYDNVHDMKHDCEVVGWNLDYHQIDPGRFSAFVAARKVGDIWVMIKQVNLRIEVLGTPPTDHITIISPDAGQSLWTNGFRLEESDALLLQPDASVHLLGGPTTVVQAHIPTGLLRRLGMSDSDIRTIANRDGALVVNLASEAARSLRWLMSSAVFAQDRFAGQEREALKLAASAGRVALSAINQQRHADVPRSESWRTISRAREFIETNLHRPIKMRHVSDYAAASVSKLERTFQRELCITPSRYILVRRLHAVHCNLKSVIRRDAKVSDLAMQYGFRHLGRFSAAYRAHFGELPSQTLQAQAH